MSSNICVYACFAELNSFKMKLQSGFLFNFFFFLLVSLLRDDNDDVFHSFAQFHTLKAFTRKFDVSGFDWSTIDRPCIMSMQKIYSRELYYRCRTVYTHARRTITNHTCLIWKWNFRFGKEIHKKSLFHLIQFDLVRMKIEGDQNSRKNWKHQKMHANSHVNLYFLICLFELKAIKWTFQLNGSDDATEFVSTEKSHSFQSHCCYSSNKLKKNH